MIRIGCRYRPKPAPMDADARFISDLLMNKFDPSDPCSVPLTLVMLVIGALGLFFAAA